MNASMKVLSSKRLPRLILAAVAVLAVTIATATAPSAAPKPRVTFKTGTYPGILIAAYGSIWVADHRDIYVDRINPKTNRMTAIAAAEDSMCSLDASGGSIWASTCGDPPSHYVRINPHTGKVGPEKTGSNPYLAAGSLWMMDASIVNLLRLDPRTRVVVKRFPITFSDPTMGGLNGFAYGSMWLADQQTVWRVDTATNTVTVIPLPGARPPLPSQGFADSAEMAFANGKVWYGSPVGLYEIDAKTSTTTLLPIPIGDFANLGDIAVVSALGSIWIRTSGTNVDRIDLTTGNIIDHYPASGGGGWIAVANGSLWVANAGNNTVWREPLH